jgi:hypothetical protein
MAYLEEGGDGVSGWLGAFVVMVGIFSPLKIVMGMVQLYNDPSIQLIPPDMWSKLQMLQWAVAVVSIGLCFYIVWRLFRRQQWKTVPIVIALMWVVGAGSLIAQLVGISQLTGAPISYLAGALTVRDYLPLVFCVAWTIYFLVSKRVANTYPRHPDDDEVRQAFE